jgi:serine/threonine protein kinase
LLSRLERIEFINQGSSASVFRAFDSDKDIDVAIKLAPRPQHPDPDTDQGVPFSILREATLLRSLDHPNIISLHQVITLPSSVCLVLDLYSCDLSQHLAELRDAGHVTMDAVNLRRIASDMLTALAYCHEQGVMHRSA